MSELKPLTGPSGDTPEDFSEGQWWLKELDTMVKDGSPDQKRAVAVVRNLMTTAKTQQAEVVQYTRADLDRAYSAGLVEGERLAIQQTEAVENKLNFCQECGSKLHKQIPVLLKENNVTLHREITTQNR